MRLDHRATEWAGYTRVRNHAVVACVTWALLIGLVLLFPESAAAEFWWLAAPFVLAWTAWTLLRLNRWPCPRCGAPFHMRGWLVGNTFSRRCLNCGIEKFSA